MANKKHIAILNKGVEAWNEWRRKNHGIHPNLIGANLSLTDLIEANLIGANLTQADLSVADLGGANLIGANLSSANLSEANLSEADLSGADLSGADLTESILTMSNLIDATLNGATLTGAKLWETQRAGWRIKGVICEYAFWDRGGKERNEYAQCDFERAFAENPIIRLQYKGGMNHFDLIMLPLMLEKQQAEHPGCKLSFRSIQDEGGKATVTIIVEDNLGRTSEELQKEVEVVQKSLEGYQLALEEEKKTGVEWRSKFEALRNDVFPLLLESYKKTQQKHTQEDKSLTVFILDLVGSSTMPAPEQDRARVILRETSAPLLHRYDSPYKNTWGDSVKGGFTDVNKALECACKLVRHPQIENLNIRTGMSHGTVKVSYNKVREMVGIDGVALSEAARLEPIANTAEVLVSKSLRFHPDVDPNRFIFTKEHRRLKKAVGDKKVGDEIACYAVQMKKELGDA